MTLCNYLKEFFSVFGLIASLLISTPIIGIFSNIKYMVPPIEIHHLLLLIIVVIISILLTYFIKDVNFINNKWSISVAIILLLLVSIISFLFYINRYQKTVCSVHIASEKTIDRVIIGTEKTDRAKKLYPKMNDIDMLKDYGYTPERIKDLFQPESVDQAYLFIIGSYFLTMWSLVEITAICILKTLLNKEFLMIE